MRTARVGEHVVGRRPTRSACRSRARRPARRGCAPARRRARRAGSRSRARCDGAQRLGRARRSRARSSPDDGSSSSSSFGLGHQRPPDLDQPARRPRLSDSTGSVGDVGRGRAGRASPAPRSFSAAVGRPRYEHVLPERARCRCGTRSATRKCSRTVMPANSSMRWNVRPMPERGPACASARR